MSVQQPLFDMSATAHARRSDPETSHEAAAEVTPRITQNQRQLIQVIHDVFDDRSFTDLELVREYNYAANREVRKVVWQSDSGIRTRRKELVEMGLLRRDGKIRVGSRFHSLWRVV